MLGLVLILCFNILKNCQNVFQNECNFPTFKE